MISRVHESQYQRSCRILSNFSREADDIKPPPTRKGFGSVQQVFCIYGGRVVEACEDSVIRPKDIVEEFKARGWDAPGGRAWSAVRIGIRRKAPFVTIGRDAGGTFIRGVRIVGS